MKHERADAAIGFARHPRVIAVVMALGVATLAGCSSFEAKVPSLGYNGTIHRGYVADGKTVDNLKPGLSKEQVLSQLGTPIPEQAREVSAAETAPQAAARSSSSCPPLAG